MGLEYDSTVALKPYRADPDFQEEIAEILRDLALRQHHCREEYRKVLGNHPILFHIPKIGEALDFVHFTCTGHLRHIPRYIAPLVRVEAVLEAPSVACHESPAGIEPNFIDQASKMYVWGLRSKVLE